MEKYKTKTPNSGKIVSLSESEGIMYLATEKGIYKLVGDVLVRLSFEEIKHGPE